MAGPSICPRTGRVGRHKWLTHSIVALSTSSLSRPRFFPCPSFPNDNWSSLKIVAKSFFPRNRLSFVPFLASFFFVQLKIKNFILESWNFASFYKSFIPISFLLLFFNFKFLTFLPFDGDGGRIELECFEKFKFSVSLFVWSPFIETSPSWLAPPRSLKCSSRNQLPSTVRILLIMPLLHPSFHPLIKRSNYVSLKNLTAISAFPNRYALSTERSIDRLQASIIIPKKKREGERKKRSRSRSRINSIGKTTFERNLPQRLVHFSASASKFERLINFRLTRLNTPSETKLHGTSAPRRRHK